LAITGHCPPLLFSVQAKHQKKNLLAEIIFLKYDFAKKIFQPKTF